jgi:hypothetical protein
MSGTGEVTSKASSVGARLAFVENVVPEVDFANRLRTARGFGFGLLDLSRKEIRIPRNVRKKMTQETTTMRSGAVFINKNMLFPRSDKKI